MLSDVGQPQPWLLELWLLELWLVGLWLLLEPWLVLEP